MRSPTSLVDNANRRFALGPVVVVDDWRPLSECWCGHRRSEHTGLWGMCAVNIRNLVGASALCSCLEFTPAGAETPAGAQNRNLR